MKRSVAKQALLDYLMASRGAGHTTAMLKGAREATDSLVLCATKRDADRIFKQSFSSKRERYISIIDLPFLRGCRQPLLIDNYALMILLGEE